MSLGDHVSPLRDSNFRWFFCGEVVTRPVFSNVRLNSAGDNRGRPRDDPTT